MQSIVGILFKPTQVPQLTKDEHEAQFFGHSDIHK